MQQRITWQQEASRDEEADDPRRHVLSILKSPTPLERQVTFVLFRGAICHYDFVLLHDQSYRSHARAHWKRWNF